MTPEEKAKKLEDKFFNEFKCWYEVLHNVADVPDKVYLARAKKCAILCADEIISEIERVGGYEYDFSDEQGHSVSREDRIDFFEKVKQSILNS